VKSSCCWLVLDGIQIKRRVEYGWPVVSEVPVYISERLYLPSH
jgi:hypothetical protein